MSNSLVDLNLEVQNMLYWFKLSIVSLENSRYIQLPALGSIIVGLPLATETIVLQFNTNFNTQKG